MNLPVAATESKAADVAGGETRSERRASANRLGADRIGHREAGAIEAGDHAAVGAQHLAPRVGARPTLGAEDDAVTRRRVERRLVDRAEIRVTVLRWKDQLFPLGLAASEIRIPA